MAQKWFRFSLRSLLVVSILMGCLCGYLAYANRWMHHRGEFLKKQQAKYVAAFQLNYKLRSTKYFTVPSISELDGLNVTEPTRIPLLLTPFRASGLRTMRIVVDAKDLVHVPVDGISTAIRNTQPDYVKAKNLFPESEIDVYYVIGSGMGLAAVLDKDNNVIGPAYFVKELERLKGRAAKK